MACDLGRIWEQVLSSGWPSQEQWGPQLVPHRLPPATQHILKKAGEAPQVPRGDPQSEHRSRQQPHSSHSGVAFHPHSDHTGSVGGGGKPTQPPKVSGAGATELGLLRELCTFPPATVALCPVQKGEATPGFRERERGSGRSKITNQLCHQQGLHTAQKTAPRLPGARGAGEHQRSLALLGHQELHWVPHCREGTGMEEENRGSGKQPQTLCTLKEA